MQRSLAAALPGLVGHDARLEGWLHNRRRLSRVGFAIVRDRSGLGQVVVDDPALIEWLDAIERESVLRADGVVVENAAAPGGAELLASSIEVLAPAVAPPPVELFRPSVTAQLPTLLDHAAIAWRHPAERARWQLAAASLASFRETLDGPQVGGRADGE